MNNQPENKIADILIAKKKTLAVAESCTGGLVSSRLTDVSGSSEYTKINFVTYSNEAKHKYLGVKNETLKAFGAVSEETAKEMAQGLINNTDCDYALSITGIAGPAGGSAQKPVGLVYIGAASKSSKTVQAYKYITDSTLSRTEIKEDFASKALDLILNFIQENEK